MTTEATPRTSPEIGGMGHSVKRKEDPRFIRGQGEYIEDVNLPGQLWLDIVPKSEKTHLLTKEANDAYNAAWRDVESGKTGAKEAFTEANRQAAPYLKQG